MEPLLAGLIIVHAMGSIMLAFVVINLTAFNDLIKDLYKSFPDKTPLPMVTISLTLGLQIICILLSLGLAAIYWATRENMQSAIGSPAWIFTVGIIAITILLVSAVTLIQPRWWKRAILLAIPFLGSFGWVLPNLADH